MNIIEFRKVQGIVGNHSYSLILPKQFVADIGIIKGDYVRVSKVDRKLIVEKVEDPQEGKKEKFLLIIGWLPLSEEIKFAISV